MKSKNLAFSLLSLFVLLSIPLITSQVATLTQQELSTVTPVYSCDNGVETYLGQASYGTAYSWCPLPQSMGGEMGCWCNSQSDNLYITSDGSEHCLPPSQAPLECSKKIVACYEAINGKCVNEASYGECKYFSNLQDCVTYVNYYGHKVNWTSILLGGISIILLGILIAILRFVKKNPKRKPRR